MHGKETIFGPPHRDIPKSVAISSPALTDGKRLPVELRHEMGHSYTVRLPFGKLIWFTRINIYIYMYIIYIYTYIYQNPLSPHQLRVLSKGRQLASLFLLVVVGLDYEIPTQDHPFTCWWGIPRLGMHASQP